MPQCPFCTESAKTNEDVWPLWLIQLVGGTRPRTDIRNKRGGVARSWNDPRVKVKVCKGCNNGWMSDLEQRAKPLIASMARGAACHIAPGEARVLAAWAVKAAMLFEYASSRDGLFYQQSDRAHLKENGEPPTGTAVWLGVAMRSSHHVVYAFGGEQQHAIPVLGAVRAFNPTIVIGHLALQVLSLRFERSWLPVEERPQRQTVATNPSSLVSIWPCHLGDEAISWPPRRVLVGPRQFEGLAARFDFPVTR